MELKLLRLKKLNSDERKVSKKFVRKLNEMPKLKLIVKLKRKLLVYSLKPRLGLTLKLRLKVLLMLPLLSF